MRESGHGAEGEGVATRFLCGRGRRLPRPAGGSLADISHPQSWNQYTYVLNNPATIIDPTGLLYCKPDKEEGMPNCIRDSDWVKMSEIQQEDYTHYDSIDDGKKAGRDVTVNAFADLLALLRASQNAQRQAWIQQARQVATDEQRVQMLSLAGAQAAHDLGCAGVPTGLNATGTALFVAGQPVTGTKRFITPGSSKGTSALSEYLRGKMGTSAEGIWAPTGGPGTGKALGLSATTDIGAATARWAPFVGLAANVVSVGVLVHCLSSHP